MDAPAQFPDAADLPVRRPAGAADAHSGVRYWAAAGLVLISVGVRLLLSPYLASGYGYTCFYPGGDPVGLLAGRAAGSDGRRAVDGDRL